MTEIEPIRKKVVALSGGGPDGRYRPLFEALGQLFPVEFRWEGRDAGARQDGLIVLDGDVSAGCAAAEGGVASFVVLESGNSEAVPGTEVRLGNSPLLDERLRDQLLNESDVKAYPPLSLLPGDEVLGAMSGRPFWLKRPAGPGAVQIVALAPPVLGENEYLIAHFHGSRFLRLLPLMNFLRRLVEEVDWEVRTQHACLVFDDPNLHWPSYGFLDFRSLAEHANRHDYFVAVATIPLDWWWVDSDVAALFRSQSPRLSLLIHGNNHTRNEMLRLGSGDRGLAVAAQALRRMERMERRHGLAVARIMEPPYGVIDAGVFPHLLALGYEAALVTLELLLRHNPSARWPATFGLERSAMVGGGLPLIPRIRASAYWKNDIVLAAFLRQPVVVALHHHDAARDMDALTEVARVVKGLGKVAWTDLRGILRGNYAQRTIGDTLCVRMHSRSLTLSVPAGVRRVCIERTWIAAGQVEEVAISSGRGSLFEGAIGAFSHLIDVEAAEKIDVVSVPANQLPFAAVAQPGIPVWPVARKFMMETRDRMTPVLSRFGFGGHSIRKLPP